MLTSTSKLMMPLEKSCVRLLIEDGQRRFPSNTHCCRRAPNLGSPASLFASLLPFLQPNREYVLAMEELCYDRCLKMKYNYVRQLIM